jgi:hypothetical protein
LRPSPTPDTHAPEGRGQRAESAATANPSRCGGHRWSQHLVLQQLGINRLVFHFLSAGHPTTRQVSDPASPLRARRSAASRNALLQPSSRIDLIAHHRVIDSKAIQNPAHVPLLSSSLSAHSTRSFYRVASVRDPPPTHTKPTPTVPTYLLGPQHPKHHWRAAWWRPRAPSISAIIPSRNAVGVTTSPAQAPSRGSRTAPALHPYPLPILLPADRRLQRNLNYEQHARHAKHERHGRSRRPRWASNERDE